MYDDEKDLGLDDTEMALDDGGADEDEVHPIKPLDDASKKKGEADEDEEEEGEEEEE